MTNANDPDGREKATIPAEEYGSDGRGADYTTTGDPIDDPEHIAEEHELHATVGNPLDGEDIIDDDVDRTTPGNPITSVEHEVEEEIPHATPGNNPVIPED